MQRIVFVLDVDDFPKECVRPGKCCPMYWSCIASSRKVPKGKRPAYCRLTAAELEFIEPVIPVGQGLLSVDSILKLLKRMDLKEISYEVRQSKSSESIYVTLNYKSETSILRLSDHGGSPCKTIYIGETTEVKKIERSFRNEVNNLKCRYINNLKLKQE